jgi:FeS assembly SUF system regulator
MLRMSRLTDYAILLMTYLADHPDRVHAAHEVADGAHLRLPTVSKLLRILAREGLLVSHRGVKGGYGLARSPDEITVAAIIRAIEGPIALTDCNVDAKGCEHEVLCRVRGHWQRINFAVRDALESISLSDMASPSPLLWMTSATNRMPEKTT